MTTSGVSSLHASLADVSNCDTFPDVTILILCQRPPPCTKAERKSVPLVYTFHAHKIVLSARSSVFAEYFRDHPKVCMQRSLLSNRSRQPDLVKTHAH
jgi:hypothetical protein